MSNPNTWNESRSPNTRSIPGLQDTCQATGGLFIESSKVDVSDIVALLSKSIESSKVSFSINSKLGKDSNILSGVLTQNMLFDIIIVD